MVTELSLDWFYKGVIDFELKQYTLLAYLQYVSVKFNANKLYKPFEDLLTHYNVLKSFERNSFKLEEEFHKELKGWGINKQAVYDQTEVKNDEINELKEIVLFAIEQILEKLEQGRAIYDEVDRQLNFNEIGIVAPLKDSGYLIILYIDCYKIYQYKKSMIILAADVEKYPGLSLRYWSQYERAIETTFDSIKSDILKICGSDLPAVFAVEFSSILFPFEETVFPVIKRKFLKHLCRNNNTIHLLGYK